MPWCFSPVLAVRRSSAVGCAALDELALAATALDAHLLEASAGATRARHPARLVAALLAPLAVAALALSTTSDAEACATLAKVGRSLSGAMNAHFLHALAGAALTQTRLTTIGHLSFSL